MRSGRRASQQEPEPPQADASSVQAPATRRGRSPASGRTRRTETSRRPAPESEGSTGALDPRQLLRALLAFRRGDFSARLPPDLTGLDAKIADAFNDGLELCARLSSELTRLCKLVGEQGRISERATLGDVQGAWLTSLRAVNALLDDLVHPVSETSRVIGAVARGDLSQTVALCAGDRALQGEFLRTAKTVNTMVSQLSAFSSEVTRVAREVGTEGKLGGQARVRGVSGTWKNLTDNVNLMAGNLTAQVRNIADVATAVASGDLSQKITVDARGEILDLKGTMNTMVDQLSSFAAEVTRVAREVGTEGKLGGQAHVRGVAGVWKHLTDNVNLMAGNLTAQVRNVAGVTKAVANGDLSRQITVDVRGEMLELKNTINVMVDQLNSFASEVTRVAREVGTEGKLGGQAKVSGVAGVWKDLTNHVNLMAGNLTAQVRNVADVTKAVANGDLSKQITVDVRGEMLELKNTINVMVDQLNSFAYEVTRVAREVGTEGKLGGQAEVSGVSGTWKDLTENVNQLAENLTIQMRAIADVATAVTTGDLTRSISVSARGEVASLTDHINEMIRHLRETTRINAEQDWLKTNLAKFSRMLQGQKDLLQLGRLILSELAPVVAAQHGVFYILETHGEEPRLRLLASYAAERGEALRSSLALGEGLVGQCALEQRKFVLERVPSEYIRISSGLGAAAPTSVVVLPVRFEGQLRAVLELASFETFSPAHHALLDQLSEMISIVLNTIEANSRTENFLAQSRSLAIELQRRQEELEQTNQQLEEKAVLLAQQNAAVERQNREIEQARQALEEKAEQLALTSRYKSEFLANMSHELRTPLNSLLILSDQLARNDEQNLSPRQVEFARTVHDSGRDLLVLINDILDLAKIESGTVVVDVGELFLGDLRTYVERSFAHIAESKGLRFTVHFAPDLPECLEQDQKRLQQIVKNLLSNAFKFTERGEVEFSVSVAKSGWPPEAEALSRADTVLALAVRDTGIGIPLDKQEIIFEAFQQADGSMSRRYGGTGLGLAISRGSAQLLGGCIQLQSARGRGSQFTLYLPRVYPLGGVRPAAQPDPERAATSEPLFAGGTGVATIAAPAAPAAGLAVASDTRPQLLIVEPDEVSAATLEEAAREQGWSTRIAESGAQAVALLEDQPVQAVLLELALPDIDGLRVLRRIKADPLLRHIPVQVFAADGRHDRALALGAWAALGKPLDGEDASPALLGELLEWIEKPSRDVLVLSERAHEFTQPLEQLGARVVPAAALEAGGAPADARRFAFALVDAQLPESSAQRLLERVDRSAVRRLPLLFFGAGVRDPLAAHDPGALLARDVPQLLDRAALLLHRPLGELSPELRGTLRKVELEEASLVGRTALLVDDDVRNIFALSTVLEREGMVVRAAEDGRSAIESLRSSGGVDALLLDIMMPGMDGFETMRRIRRLPRFRDVPVIAVTAKAMKGDAEKTLAAGAWCHLAKPVDANRVLAVLRAWLHR